MTVFLWALAMLGATLMLSFAVGEGNILHFLVRSYHQKLDNVMDRVDRLRETVEVNKERLGKLRDAFVPPHGEPLARMKQNEWDIAYALITSRQPTKEEKHQYHRDNNKSWPKGQMAIDYHLLSMDEEYKLENVKLQDNQQIATLAVSEEAKNRMQERLENEVHKIENQIIPSIIKEGDKIDFWLKPFGGCPACSLLWIGTITFAIGALMGRVEWDMYLEALTQAYAILLTPQLFTKN